MFYFMLPIAKHMKRKGVKTQDELAECAKVSTGTMSKLMNKKGCTSINLKTLIAVCNVLDVNVWKVVREAESHE